MNEIENCLCTSLKYHQYNVYESQSQGIWWDDEDVPFGGICARGYDDEKATAKWGNHESFVNYFISQWVADFYLLEAIGSGLLKKEELVPKLKLLEENEKTSLIWRRNVDHPFNTLSSKGCGCPLKREDNKEKRVAACSHDDSLSEFSWYLFHSISSKSLPAYLEEIVEKARTLQETLVKDITPVLWGYGMIAFAGELMYIDIGSLCNNNLSSLLGAFSAMEEYIGAPQLLQYIHQMFDENYTSWSPRYGGEAWADCVYVYQQAAQGIFSDKVFVDRVFNLQHNTSCFLNKVTWGDLMSTVTTLLEAHGSSNYGLLYDYASLKVKGLWSQYFERVNYERSLWNMEKITAFT